MHRTRNKIALLLTVGKLCMARTDRSAVGARGIEEQVDPSDVESCAIRSTPVGKSATDRAEIEHVEQEGMSLVGAV